MKDCCGSSLISVHLIYVLWLQFTLIEAISSLIKYQTKLRCATILWLAAFYESITLSMHATCGTLCIKTKDPKMLYILGKRQLFKKDKKK